MSDRPAFIDDQAWSLLTDFQRPQDHLHASQFRPGRARRADLPPDAQPAPSPWIDFDPIDLLAGETALDGQQIDLRRTAITTDAGIGKTTTTHWLQYALPQYNRGLSAIRFTVRELCADHGPVAEYLLRAGTTLNDAVVELLAERHFYDRLSDRGCTLAHARQAVQQQRLRGRLVLVIDELDQPGGGIDRLVQLLESPFWSRCRFILAGRPYALQRYWPELFEGRSWVYLKLEEFDADQQRRCLGQTPDGQDRYDLIPKDARPILGVPRVLQYLRELPDATLRQKIHTAADVYFHTILHLIHKGMQGSADARRLGWPEPEPPPDVHQQHIREARRLLSAIAYTLTRQLRREKDSIPGQTRLVSNFDRIPSKDCDCDFEQFESQLATRYQSKGTLARDWQALAALNDILEQGVFDTGVVGLKEIQFRNRSLQEFLCAWYLAREATPDDADTLWNWIYLADRPETEEYYYIWQFLCEIPNDQHDGFRPANWLTAIEPLYRPCFAVDPKQTDPDQIEWGAKRSSEMIFRSFARLAALCEANHAQAITIRDRWWGEFEGILAGKQGAARQAAAQAFLDSFLTLRAGSFRMGSPPSHTSRKNDEPEGLRVAVHAFQLSRFPTINHWFRLFDPGHGLAPREYYRAYADVSPTPDAEHPAVYVSWYDAWAFCRWARWKERRGDLAYSCRLPFEHEWEYVAKDPQHWDWSYWWGPVFDGRRCTAGEGWLTGHTRPLEAHVLVGAHLHDSPRGFRDILGNVWEWCQDVYCPEYRRTKADDPDTVGLSRVSRGGSWYEGAVYCRCAYRGHGTPGLAGAYSGFRVARAVAPSDVQR